MSKKVDERVVEMRFENGQFEKGVAQSTESLNKLKESLNLEGAAKGLENVNSAAKNTSGIESLAASLEKVEHRFSTMGIVGKRVIENLTDSAMRLANRAIRFLTSGIIQGGINRAKNLENAHFQLQGLLKDEEAVSAVMKNVSDSVDGTAYSLDAAAKVASQLAASGMRAGDEMYKSLRAVAGVAAMTNSDYESIGQIFTTVAGNGRLMGEQLLQLSSRGMNAAAVLGEALGKSESEIRDMVSKGKIDFQTFADAMDDAFGEHAKKANETFNGALSNIKAALARIGALFISPLIVQNGPIVKFFNTFRERVNDVKKSIGPLADQFTGSVNKMADAATSAISRFDSEDRALIFTNIVSTLTSAFSGLWSILKPVGQAFRDIFPQTTASQLIVITDRIKDLIAKIQLGAVESENLRDTFKGVFSVLKFAVGIITSIAKGVDNLLSHLTGVRGGFLGITGAVGRWVTKMTGATKAGDAFKSVIAGVSSYLGRGVDGIKNFLAIVKEKFVAPGFEKFADILQKLWDLVKKIGSKINEFLSGIAASFNGDSLTGAFTMINALVLLKIAYRKFFDDWKPLITRWKQIINDGFLKTIKDITSAPEGIVSAFNAVKSSLWTFNKSMKYNNIMKLAKALFVLASAMLIISLIDTDKMVSSMAAITALVAELMAVIKFYDAFGKTAIKDSVAIIAASTGLIQMSVAVLILASALKKLSGLSWEELAKGLSGVTGLVAILVAAAKIMNKEKLKMSKFGKQMILMSAAILILASACKKLSGLSWEGLAKGVSGVLIFVGTFVAAAKILNSNGKAISKFAGQMIFMSIGISIMAAVAKSLSELSWEELGKGATGLLAIVSMLVAATKIMSKNSGGMLKASAPMILFAAAIAIVGQTMKSLSGMSWDELDRGIVGIGGSIAIFAAGLKAMSGSAKGAGSLLLAAVALGTLTPVLLVLGSMSWEAIAKSMTAIAAAFTVLGLAGLILKPVVPTIALLGASIALIGVGCLAAGAGLELFSAGIAALVGVIVASATGIAASLKVILLGLLDMVPELASSFEIAIRSLMQTLINLIPDASQALVQLILGALNAIANNIPQLMDGVSNLVLGLIRSLTTKLPEFTIALVNFLATLVNSLAEDIQPLVDGFANLFGTVIKGAAIALGPVIKDVVRPILEVFAEIVDSIAPYIPGICGAISDIVDAVTDAAIKIAPCIQGTVTVIAMAIDTIALYVAEIVQQIPVIIQSITDLIRTGGSVINGILLNIAEIIRSVGETINEVFNGAAEVISSCGEAIEWSLNGMAEAVSSVFEGIAYAISSAGKAIKDVLDGIADIIDSIGRAALNAGVGFERLANGIAIITGLNLVDMAASLTAVAVGVGKISSNGDDLKKCGDAMSELEKSTTISSQAFATMAESIGLVSSTLPIIGDIAASSMAALVSVLSDSSGAFDGFIDSTGAAQESIKEFGSALDAAISEINSYYTDFYKCGEYLATGFTNGIKSNSYKAKLAAIDMANLVDQAVREKLGIESPSKVFKEIGGYVAKGFARGIENFSYLGTRAVESMSNNVIDSASKVLSNITAALTNDVNTQPTIRPVVDLSNVESSSDAISNMLAIDPTVSAFSNVRSISAMMNRNQNGANDDVVSAIKDLGKTIGKASGDTYQINGITYDSGSEVSEAIQTLIRASIIEGRR
jgi:tape measure domain-containing protein